MIGHAEAVTDVPCASFASELMAAYPDALVIINKRSDIDAWYRSLCASLDETAAKTGPLGIFWVIYFSHRKLFWMRRMFERTQNTFLWQNDWTRNAKRRYREHYEMLLWEAEESRRLVWTVEDGWGPLCKFLGKEVPEELFPRGNAQDAYLQYVMEKHVNVYAKEAVINVLGALVGIVAVGFAIYRWR